jgi:small subunit ribosomal protein S1
MSTFYITKNNSSEKKFHPDIPDYNNNDEIFESLIKDEFNDSMIKEGDVIDGIINSIDRNFVLINVGSKSEGKIPIQQFIDNTILEVGKKIPVYVERTETKDGNILLSYTKALKKQLWNKLYDIHIADDNEDVEGIVLYTIKSGCIVDIDGLNAFLPNSHIDVKPVSDPTTLVGVKLKFRILKMDEKTGKIFVSRRKALGAVHEEAKNEFISTLKEGQIINGKVKSITNYGVFVQIHESDKTGSIDGLLYINDVAWSRVTHPSSLYSVDQEIKVKIIAIDAAKGKISLGVKQLTENPWKDISKKYLQGKVYPGMITSIEDYGAFVQLEEGVEGLVHNGEMSWTKKKVLLLPNQKVNVMVLSVDEDNHKIALSIRQCTSNPWARFLDFHTLGSIINCRISELTESGIVVNVADENFSYVNGIIRNYNLSWKTSPKKDIKQFKVGDEIKAKLIHVNTNRGKVAFSLKHVEHDPFEEFLGSIKEGETIKVKILRVEDDGIYVEVREKLEFFTPQDDVSNLTVGQQLSFIVKNKEKYSLRLVQKKEDEKDDK